MAQFDAFGRTKVICTIGPASESTEKLRQLIQVGMDVARLNFSHGNREKHKQIIDTIRSAAVSMDEHVGILQDLSGPKIRTGTVAGGQVLLEPGKPFTITTEQREGNERIVSTTYSSLPKDVHKGTTLLIDDGLLSVRVESVVGSEVRCVVVNGGVLKDKKGINLPGVAVSAPSMTAKDHEDLQFGLAQGVDIVALSFVRSADDILQLRKLITAAGLDTPIVAKIERAEAIERFDEILTHADAIMVARGDLGVELPPEEVPLIQKQIVRSCNNAGKPVIIATQMLESMIDQPRPTRAEANDVANAVLDGADAVMLSGETSVGKFAVEAAGMMDQIIRRSERNHRDRLDAPFVSTAPGQEVFDAIARAACVLAGQVEAKAIVALTRSGSSARTISRFRPLSRVVAVTHDAKVLRRLNMVWSIRGILLEDTGENIDKTFSDVIRILRESKLVSPGDRVVFTGGYPPVVKGTNTIRVLTA